MEGSLVIVADRFECIRALCVIDGQAQRILMEFQRLRHGKPLAGDVTGGQQGSKGPCPQLSAADRTVGPREVGILAENRRPVVVGDQLGELLRVVSRDLLEPASGLGMGPSPPDSWQARVRHVAHEGMFEDELELAGDAGCRMNGDQPFGLE